MHSVVHCWQSTRYALEFLPRHAQSCRTAPQVEVKEIINRRLARFRLGVSRLPPSFAMSLVRQTLSAETAASISAFFRHTGSARLRRLGFEPRVVEIQSVAMPSRRSTSCSSRDLPAGDVLIEGQLQRQSRLRDFNEHRQQRNSYASFMIRRRSGNAAREHERAVQVHAWHHDQGSEHRREHNTGFALPAEVWPDGQRVPGAELRRGDYSGDSPGIEFYTSTPHSHRRSTGAHTNRHVNGARWTRSR